jgi:hypothetical protein
MDMKEKSAPFFLRKTYMMDRELTFNKRFFFLRKTHMMDRELTFRTRVLQVYSLTACLIRSGSDINKSSPATYTRFIPGAPQEVKT